MDKEEEKTLEEQSKRQTNAEETLPGRQLGLYSKVDKKEVRNMVSETGIRIRIVWVAGDSFDKIGYLCKTLAFQLFVMYKVVEQ